MSDVDPYDRDENVFRTDGPNCHWCTSGTTAFVWGPYGTHVCAHCQAMIEEGRQWEVVEGLAARLTVRGRWHMLDPEHWREREHALMARWLQVRTTCTPITDTPSEDA